MNINDFAALASIGIPQLEQKSETVTNSGKGVSTFGTEIVKEKELTFKKNEFNVYGDNIENFHKFKGKDKYDALNATNKAATNVNNLYNDFKKAHPDVDIEFEAPPNPSDYGKKREGFQSYMQALERWENSCKKAIDEARKDQEMTKSVNNQSKPLEKNPIAAAPETPPEVKKPPKTPKKNDNKFPSAKELEEFLKKNPYEITPMTPEDIDNITSRMAKRFNETGKKNNESSSPPSNLRPVQNSPGVYLDKNTGKFVKWGKQPIE